MIELDTYEVSRTGQAERALINFQLIYGDFKQFATILAAIDVYFEDKK